MAKLETATSRPFMITLPSGTKLYGITETYYTKDGNTIKPQDPDKGSPLYYYTEVSRSEWVGEDNGGIQYAAPGTGAPKFYNLQGAYNYDGNGRWITDGIVGVGAELKQEFAKSNAGKPTQISTVIATGPKAVALAANVPASGLAAKLFNTNTATPPPQTQPGSGATPTPTEPKEINDPGLSAEQIRPDGYGNYYYPETLSSNQNKQDVVKFTAYSYGGRPLTLGGASSSNFGTPGLADRILNSINGSVTLPIQPSITDTNSVTWGNEELNPLQAFGAAVSYAAGEDITAAGQQAMTTVEKLFKESGGNVEKAVRVYLAGKAVGVNGLLSRVGGAVLNPNMELLFQGPQLRPFTFTFRLSPRSSTEATQVKNIIRFFKQNMSIKNSESNLFLKAPNVFQIRYIVNGENKDHPSLNRIKICALQSCSVDYTPDGSYMTFNDDTKTMTSYGLTLQFMELEPITERDYSNDRSKVAIQYEPVSLDEIGY